MEDEDGRYDVSTKRQSMILRIICEDIENRRIMQRIWRDMPTEMKLIYDVQSGKFKAQYKYDLVYTNDEVKTASHIADEWFEEVKNNNL